MSAERNMIVAGFPGVGKSAASRQCPDWIDFESSGFHWLPSGEENPKWPGNYIKAILDYDRDNVGKVIMISTHDVVVKAIAKHRPIVCVVPDEDLRNEYMIRYLRRGSPAYFIKKMAANWNDYINDITGPWARGLKNYGNHKDSEGYLENYTVIFLGPGQWLSDVLPRM